MSFPPRTLSEWMLDLTLMLWVTLVVYSIGQGIIVIVDAIREAWASRKAGRK